MNDSFSWKTVLASTILRELTAAISGLVLVLFIFGHLAGNFLLFLGPDAFNGYAERLQSLGPLLWLARLVILTAAVLHVSATISLKLRNRASRDTAYAVTRRNADRPLGTPTMIYTGIIIACFVILHISDFTLADKTGPRSIIGGQSLGLYGVVLNGFANPLRAVAYIVAVWAVGLHFSHLFSSLWVTLGVLSDRATRAMNRLALAVGVLVALGFTAIPVFALIKMRLLGG
ncbi:MAG TPA: succinate dehydrogenase cytochrome b subunit [Candidatus Hydrogenedentes bacterium]|nr:succinate dehydrogenase cytochrome b subunit [Candidatus Hydrogenedentota bacterium]HPU96812.1 succinate dehydrogenase cytochrome b subunit [Candidatus Hydrogenedentota bacterium]